MALRLHEIHPSLVHFPLALIPTAVIADLLGKLFGNQRLMDFGAKLMPVAAASGVVAGAAGLVAQEAVKAEGRSHDMLVTHRNLNFALVVATAALAAVRQGHREPGLGYLATGLAGLAAMSYTAYLGGKMVYDHGVGVNPAGGLLEGESPELRRATLGDAVATGGHHAAHAIGHAARHLREGEIAPVLRRHAAQR